ncbi:YceO family protein [Enterobacter hormaechei]
MRRLVNYLINNIREHFMLYIVLWSLLAIVDVILLYSSENHH